MGSLEVQEDPPPPIIPKQSSWAAATQEKKVMKKFDFEISYLEGKKSVTVPTDVVEKANLLWDDFVIAKFLEKAPHAEKVHVIVNKIWSFGDVNQRLDVFEIVEHTMRIRIPKAAVREKVIRRGCGILQEFLW